jgi:hypothetical protein
MAKSTMSLTFTLMRWRQLQKSFNPLHAFPFFSSDDSLHAKELICSSVCMIMGVAGKAIEILFS